MNTNTISSKIFLPLVIAVLLIYTVDTFYTYNNLNVIIKDNAKMRATEIKDYILATRKHYQDVFLENKTILTKNSIKFLPAHTSLRIDRIFKQTNSGQNFKVRTVSDNPRNIDNMANKLEMKAIKYFNANPSQSDYFVDTIQDGKDIYHYSYVLKIGKKCLKCHGKKENAPKVIQKLYNNSYDYKIGELRGIISIEIDKQLYNEISNMFITKIIISFVLILFVFWLLNILIVKKVSSNIHLFEEKLDSYFDFLSGKNEDIEDVIINSNDELGKLSKVVNANIQVAKKLHLEKEENYKKDLQLLEQAKMASMGEMIANIAHQWRQPLSAISSSSSGAKVQYKMGMLEDEEFEHAMDTITEKTHYLSETINTFRDYIKENKEVATVEIQERIDVSIHIVESVLHDKSIKLINEVDYKQKVKMTIPKCELSQVIINIMNNAKDILVENNTPNPWVKISTNIENNIMKIEIEDNGGGIPEDILPKIFDPYFTTKHKSQGTGLGLHMSQRIVVESLHGKLYAQNTVNGAKFVIELKITT